MSLSYEERRRTILEQLAEREKVEVQALAERLAVSAETVRRDLERLEKEGLLKKVYGGAVPPRMELREPPFAQRLGLHEAGKAAIGRYAASLVREGETIMVDHGTTMLGLVRHLRDRADVTIVTHSVPVLLLAMERFAGKLFFAGGELNARLQSVAGAMTERTLGRLNVHKAFLSVGGVSLQDGITDFDYGEASISRIMLERAEEAIVLADHSKIGKTAFAKIAELDEVRLIVTDGDCPPQWPEKFRERGTELIAVE
ncbi:DeoR/GlpR family DNA-binding transcription regulator [Paenibacillus sp. GYB003]|uniref:DeoR/GlpR family DNA-binding transcription regulator n=1 Tax=Paenibacillus sp. GYB003 TaxID=2994392 RepID=UPI002F967EC7